MEIGFEWDPIKNIGNQQKHNVSFEEAQYAFADTKRILAEDLTHKSSEARYYCFGNVDGGIMVIVQLLEASRRSSLRAKQSLKELILLGLLRR